MNFNDSLCKYHLTLIAFIELSRRGSNGFDSKYCPPAKI